MDIQERLTEDLKQAMRQGDVVRRSILRMVRSSVHNEEIAKQRSLEDAEVVQVITRMLRQNRESIEAYETGNRPELVEREKAEMAILQEYRPPQLSEDDLIELARKVIEDTGAQGLGDMGKVMSRLMPQVKGRADGAQVSALMSRLLAS
jgi:uncharacterized protein YqeY